MRATLLAALAVSSLSAFAAPAKKPTAVQARLRRFTEACTEAFRHSGREQGDAEAGAATGKLICECTAHESGHEGVAAEALERETAHIKQDPKHKIQDEKLLNAIQYCSIQVLKPK